MYDIHIASRYQSSPASPVQSAQSLYVPSIITGLDRDNGCLKCLRALVPEPENFKFDR